jgi:hypothetical protein
LRAKALARNNLQVVTSFVGGASELAQAGELLAKNSW